MVRSLRCLAPRDRFAPRIPAMPSLALSLLAATLVFLPSCATTSGVEPASAVVTWRSFEHDQSATIVTRTFENYEAVQRAGRLDPSVKLVDAETMGLMVRVLKDHRFFERATAVSASADGIEGMAPQIITYRDGGRELTMPFLARPGRDPEMVAWDRDFVKMKNALIEIHRQTFSLSVAPAKRSRR